MNEVMNAVKREELVTAVYDLTWAFRDVMDKSSKWKTPPVVDALKFACTEVGEVADAELQTIDYARNSERNPSVTGELADVAFMLCTALPMGQVALSDVVSRPLRLPATKQRIRTSNIAQLVSTAWNEWESGQHKSAETQAAQALHMVVAAIGDEAEAEVAKRLVRIYDKHATKADTVPQVVVYMRGLVGGDTAVEGEGDGEGDE